MTTMSRDRRVGLLLLVVAVLVPRVDAQTARNPLVIRSAQPRATAPVECEQGLSSTPMARVNVAEIPLPPATATEALPPPSGALRQELQQVQNALARNDRPAFDEHRAAARDLLTGYPTGAERRGADQALRLYDDA